MAEEAMQGWQAGHRNFKIKVGRNNVHMPTEAGLRRDIAVVNAIRKAVGPDAAIMTDANNGYTYNIARDFLHGTAEARPFWLDEAFWEDASTYRRLKAWIKAEGLETRIADGEGRGLVDMNHPSLYEGVENLASGSETPSGRLLDMVREGIIDVLQYDIIVPGISRWLEVGPLVDAWGRSAAPHHYGTCWGNYGSAHLAPAIRNFLFVEWDEATTPGLEAPGYAVVDGYVQVPASPGFGLELEEDAYGRAVRDAGFTLS
jgi:L-alanine-DL-glutamate epimerase-like enolase superfamily enzyme